LVSGIHALWGEENNAHRCGRPPIRSHGAAFFLGASFALVVSPCCTPLVLGILAYSSATGNAWYGSALLACFAVGHSVPLLAAAGGTHGAGAILERCGARRAAGVLGAGLMLALAGYYAVLV
jgi:cytochrome c biogenesis protein CcdA